MRRLLFFISLLLLSYPVLVSAENIYEKQLNKGIRNSDPYSYLLIQQSKTDTSRAKDLLKKAVRYSPDLPATYFEMAKASLTFKPEGIFESVDYMVQGVTAYWRNFWWLFTITTSLFISLVLSFVISILIIVIIRLIKDISLLSHDIKEEKAKIFFLLVFVFAVFGPLYLLGSLLIITSFYLKRSDRIVVYSFLLFMVISPWILDAISKGLLAAASGEIKAVVQVNESRGNTYALSVLEDSDNPVEVFSYALALKREGRYREAIDVYSKLIAKKTDPLTYNNIANCYVAINDLEKAKEYYEKSIKHKPLPSTLYNLSQVYRELLDFEKGDEYFLAAQRLNTNEVSGFRAIFSRNPNRFVIDEELPLYILWEYSLNKHAGVFTMGLSLVSSVLMSVIALSMTILFFILDRRFKNKAYRCSRCGVILCHKCVKHILWGQMCLQCYNSLVKLDEMGAKERITRILSIHEYRKKKRDIIKILSFILPGSGQIYAGRVFSGFIFLWLFLFFIFVPIMNSLFKIEMSTFSHVWVNIIALFMLLIIYFISNIIIRRRISKGWL